MHASAQASAYRVTADPGIRVQVSELACCALEAGSARTAGLLEPESSSHAPARISVLLVSGTVTELLAPAVQAQWEQLPQPRMAIAVGACASSGGPYWDAVPVLNGIADLIPTAGFIAGCPPDPQRIVSGVLELTATA